MTTFDIDKKEFLRGLGLMQSVTGRKTTLPILSHILIEWNDHSVYLTGTDLETGIREEITGSAEQPGKASVSAKKLYEIVRELPEKIIHIQKKENHWITLQCESLSSISPGSTLRNFLLFRFIRRTTFRTSPLISSKR